MGICCESKPSVTGPQTAGAGHKQEQDKNMNKNMNKNINKNTYKNMNKSTNEHEQEQDHEQEIEKVHINLQKSDSKGMLNLKELEEYITKAKKAMCKINLSNGFGSGFFCKIPYTENNNILLPVLMTNNHVLSRDSLNSENYIKITLDGETKIISLKQRKKWTDETMDFTCIEIKEEEDSIHTFFNLDDNVLDNNYSNDCYLNQKVLIYGFNKNEDDVALSNGHIIKNNDSFFVYNCNTYPGCSGGCIVNQFNNLAIGMHRGEIENKSNNIKNQGIYIKDIIISIKNYEKNALSKVNQ